MSNRPDRTISLCACSPDRHGRRRVWRRLAPTTQGIDTWPGFRTPRPNRDDARSAGKAPIGPCLSATRALAALIEWATALGPAGAARNAHQELDQLRQAEQAIAFIEARSEPVLGVPPSRFAARRLSMPAAQNDIRADVADFSELEPHSASGTMNR
jgi:hypothetical protein